MFGDWGWISRRTEVQEAALAAWLEGVRRPGVVIELGAGENVPTVRRFAESIGDRLVRINPQAEPNLPYARRPPALRRARRHRGRPQGLVREALTRRIRCSGFM